MMYILYILYTIGTLLAAALTLNGHLKTSQRYFDIASIIRLGTLTAFDVS
jgi:hypothetical protein